MPTCLFCKKILTNRQRIYCSNQCQKDFQYQDVIKNWLKDCATGKSVINTKNVSKYLKKYLLKTGGEKCSLCGWNQVHSITHRVPLEVDHIDGNSKNNHSTNLRLLCPNCHSLTPHFRNLNRGNGRKWRGG
jgi:hypothetical protein